MRRRFLAGALAAVTAVVFALASTTSAVAADGWQVAARWEMNEPAGATTLVDSSGNGLHAPIGSEVRTGVAVSGAIAHRFPYVEVTDPAAPSKYLHVVGDRSSLDPGTDAFAVEARFRTNAGNRNILQKGQSGTTGGYWKMEISGGVATCVFRGATGSVGMKSTSSVEDSVFHVVRCVRTATGAELYLDGVRQARSTTVSGRIDNDVEMVIGGKSRCNNTTVSCDYFHGDIDYVRIERSTSTTPPPTTSTTTSTSTTTTSTTSTTTTTTTTTTLPPVRLPQGSFDEVVVDGRQVTLRGRASDPDGAPRVRITDTVAGASTTFDRSSASGRFDVAFTAVAGDHTFCVRLLDTPTGQSVQLGCRSAVVK